MDNLNKMDEIYEQRGIERLVALEEYFNYAVSSTILKQQPNIDLLAEKNYARFLIHNWLVKGIPNAFTSSYNIRSNMNQCDKETVIQLLIKSAIERDVYKQQIQHKLVSTNPHEEVCQYVSYKLYGGEYTTLMDQLKNGEVDITKLIENYVDFSYKAGPEFKNNINLLISRNPINDKAMNQLNLEMSLSQLKK